MSAIAEAIQIHEATRGRATPVTIPNVGRADLARYFAEAGFTSGAEIGVERGLYSEVLCRSNPALALLAVDAWTPYPAYREHVTRATLAEIKADAEARLAPYNVTLVPKFSLAAAAGVADRSLDFVYIDANHRLEHVIADLAAWVPKVRVGGIVAGHDYCRRKPSGYNVHVVEALTAWTQVKGVRHWYLLGSKAVVPGEVRDRPRSWMWVAR